MHELNSAPVQMDREHDIRNRLLGATAAVAMAIGVAACGSGQVKKASHEGPATIPAANTANTVEGSCGVPENFSVMRMNKVYGSPESAFPSLQVEVNGQLKLMNTQQAAQQINKQLAEDPRALGLFSAFFIDTRNKLQEPDAGTLSRAEEFMSMFNSNPNGNATKQFLDTSCNLVGTELTETNSFAVTKDQATEIQAVHNSDGSITYKTAKVTTTGTLDGYTVGFNDNNPDLSSSEKAILRKLSDLILITPKGTIVINELIGPGSFTVVTNSKNTTKAKVVPSAHHNHVLVLPKESNQTHVSSANTSSNNSSKTSSSPSNTASRPSNQPSHNGHSGQSGSGSHAPSQAHGQTPENQHNGESTSPKGTGPKGTGKESKPGNGKSPGGGSHTGTTPEGTTSTPTGTTSTPEGTTPTPTGTTPTETTPTSTTPTETTPTSTTPTETTPTTTTPTTTTPTTTTPTTTTPTTTTPTKGPAPCDPSIASC